MRFFRDRNLLPLLALALGLGLVAGAACRKKASTAGQSPAGGEASAAEQAKKSAVILRVGGSYYFSGDFDAYLKRMLGSPADSLSNEARSRLFDRFVDEKLLLEAARRQGITLTEEEKSRYQSKIQEDLDTDKTRSLSPFELNSLNEQLLIQKYTYTLVSATEVTDDELKGYYAAHRSEFLQPERVRVSQILVKTEEQAIEVLARVKSLPEDGFRSMARQESIGPEASKSGEMGVFSPGQLPVEIEKVVFSLKEGEISQIVQSSYGCHIFRLDKRFPPELVSLEMAAPGIRTRLLDDKIARSVAAHLEELRRTLEWKTSPENLSFPYQRNAS